MADDLLAGKPHEVYMKRALALARRGRGLTSPNPLVGAVVVRDGRVVGEGFHRYSEKTHAEIRALEKAGSEAQGSTLYVTLEPCNHEGRTPPCSQYIIDAGVKTVFFSVRDPNRTVTGGGAETLKAAGVEVNRGLLERQATELNEAYFHYTATGRPFVTLKLALTLDGRIATGRRESKWITSERARRKVHRFRFESDAVLVGVNTVLKDDPSLDVRSRPGNTITKVILDSRLQTPPQARLFQSGDPVIIFHAPEAAAQRSRGLGPKAKLVAIPSGPDGLQWKHVLNHLGDEGIQTVLVEGGSRVATSALRHRAVHRIAFFYAAKILGGSGLAGIGDLNITELSASLQLSRLRARHYPPDVLVEAYLD